MKHGTLTTWGNRHGAEIQLGPGRELVVPRGARVSGRFTAGTRPLHIFGGRGLDRAEPQA